MYSNNDKIAIICAELNISARKFYQLLNCVDSYDAFASEVIGSWQAREVLDEHFDEFRKAVLSDLADRVIDDLSQNGVVAVTCFDKRFPQTLKDIDDPPYILFCKGDVSLLKTRCLAVVGTRKVSSYGRRVAKDFTAVLADYFTVVSGLAYGVDAIAHETTLEFNGKTIAVLGGGVIDVYPSANQGLADRIVANGGLLVSEYGMRAESFSYRFPHRNRIVAGLSQGLLVCQAPAKSGTGTTVELALEQGKDVFVVPGEVYDLGYVGSNKLIKSMQGACVTSPRDIVDFYGLEDKDDSPKQSYQPSFEEMKILDALAQGPLSFDQIVGITQIGLGKLNSLLTNLELKSIIARLPGNVYRLYGGI